MSGAVGHQRRRAVLYGGDIEQQLLALGDRSLLKAAPNAPEGSGILVEDHEDAVAQLHGFVERGFARVLDIQLGEIMLVVCVSANLRCS